VTADEDGIHGCLSAFSSALGLTISSVYEVVVVESLRVEGTYEFDGTFSCYTWDAVAGTEYKVISPTCWMGFGGVVSLNKSSRHPQGRMQSQLFLALSLHLIDSSREKMP
jgi:hypothetical protein